MQFIRRRRLKVETSTCITLASIDKMRRSILVQVTSCAIPWEEGSGAVGAVGVMTAKLRFNGAFLAQRTFALGAPATIRRTHFDPCTFGRRLALPCLSAAVPEAIQGRNWER